MALKSSFKTDLIKEQKLAPLLDKYYAQSLKYYRFERINNIEEQLLGIDLKLTHKTTSKVFNIDEKAQLDYLNEDLPTFAFEICYYKDNIEKEGWFFDTKKKTDFYALITAIYDDDHVFSSCKITLVNRVKLQNELIKIGLDRTNLKSYSKEGLQGKICVGGLDCQKEGYLFLSKKNKVEKPLNLVLKLDWLINMGLAKRMV